MIIDENGIKELKEKVESFNVGKTKRRTKQCAWADGMITVTQNILKSLQTNGSYSAACLNVLGVNPRDNKGWTKRYLGRRISASRYQMALCVKNKLGDKYKTNYNPLNSNANKIRTRSTSPLPYTVRG
jgi:hypothetical protein